MPVARQTRLVGLEGEVNAPGVYQLQPGETLKQLIARAGGFTPQAYVYGLELEPRRDARAPAREPRHRDQPARVALGGAGGARRGQPARRRCRRGIDDGGQQRRHPGAADPPVAHPAERPDRPRAHARDQLDRRLARPAARARRPHHRAAATGLRHRRRRGRQQQRLRLEAGPHRRATTCAWPAPTKPPTPTTCSSCAPTAPSTARSTSAASSAAAASNRR